MSRTHSVLGNFGWSLVNSLGLFLYGFVISAIIARILGPDDYGNYTYLVWLYTVIVLIATLGAGQTVTKYVSEWMAKGIPGQAAALVRRYLVIQAGTVIALDFILWIGLQNFPWLLGKSIAPELLFISLLIALPVTLAGTMTVTLQGLQRFRQMALAGTSSVFLSLVLILAAIVIDPDIHLFLIIVLLSQTLLLGMNFWFLKDFLRQRGDLGKAQFRSVMIYALGIYLIAFIDLVVWQRSEIYFLGRYAPSDQIAFYNLAFGLISASIYLVVTAFNSVLVPIFTRLFHEDQEAVRKGYYRTTKLAGLFVFPAAIGLTVLAPTIVHLIYGSDFHEVAGLVWILAISVSAAAIAGSGSALIYSQGKHWFSVKIGVPLAILNIFLDIILIPHYFALGAAWANTITQLMGIGAGTIFVMYTFGVKVPFGSLAKSLIAGLLMGCGVWVLGFLRLPDVVYLLSAVTIGAALYAVLIVLFRVFDSTDILMMRSVEENLVGKKNDLARQGISFLERFATRT